MFKAGNASPDEAVVMVQQVKKLIVMRIPVEAMIVLITAIVFPTLITRESVTALAQDFIE